MEVVWLERCSLNRLDNRYMLGCVGGENPFYLSYDDTRLYVGIDVVMFKIERMLDTPFGYLVLSLAPMFIPCWYEFLILLIPCRD